MEENYINWHARVPETCVVQELTSTSVEYICNTPHIIRFFLDDQEEFIVNGKTYLPNADGFVEISVIDLATQALVTDRPFLSVYMKGK